MLTSGDHPLRGLSDVNFQCIARVGNPGGAQLITLTGDSAMAAAAMADQKNGYHTPAATGTPAAL